MYRISSSLQQQSWDNQLRMESRTRDIFEDFQGTFADNKPTIPNGVVMNVKLAASKNSHVIGLLRNLSGSGTTGRTSQLGNEVDQETKEVIVYSNDVSQAVNTERYGLDAHDKAAYKILEKVQPQLSLWHKEIKGKYLREAIVERYSTNLTVAPVSGTKRWNENILVTGVTIASQPTYNNTNATYEEAIGDAITTMSTNAFDVALLNAIQYYAAVEKAIEPMDNGRYIVTVPSNQAVLLKDPSSSTSISGVFVDSQVQEAARNAYRQYLGTWGMLDLYEDPRAPRLDRTGSDGSWDITAYYKGAGSDDDRSSATTKAVDVGMILGKGAVVVAEHDKLHFEEEVQRYKKIIGVGAFGGYGCNRLVYDDVGSESATSDINQSSALILCSNNAITA